MVLEFVFNPKYEMATGHYVKIGGLITADDGKTHVFAVIKNLSSGALERQKYADCGSWKANKVMSGMDRSSLYKGACKAEDKPTFLPLAYHLKIAFSRLNDAVGFSEADKEAVLLAIEALIRDLKIEGETPAPEVKVVSESEFSDVPSEALEDDEFVKKVTFAIGGEVGKIVSVDGVKFRLHKVEGEKFQLQWNKPGTAPAPEVETTEGENVRHFITMAKVVNAEGLGGVVAGNFYPIIGEQEFNNMKFITLNVGGEGKSLKLDRVKKVQVYSDTLA